ncbi:MAG: hypothetical protein AAFR37_08715 [Cyanobacteria bacterium J06628_3]
MPEVKDQLLIDPRWSGMLVSMHCLTIFLFSPIFGILADRIGKAKVLIPPLAAPNKARDINKGVKPFAKAPAVPKIA